MLAINIEQIQQQVQSATTLQLIGSGSQLQQTQADVLDMSQYQGVIDYHPQELMLTVKAGTTIEQIKQTLAVHNQALPFSTTSTTIGAAYAMGGAEFRDAVLGVKIIDGQGRILNFGGQVMKNVAGYDVTRLLVGSKGKLAVICEVSLKVLPLAYVAQTNNSATVSQPSLLKQKIADGLKQVFDPKAVFV